MLEKCGIKLEGRHHSGIDDARNIASCVLACMKEGFEFHQGMVHSHPFNPNSGVSQEEESKE